MAYLDEDILYNNVEEKYKSAKGKAREAYSDVLDTICEMPRADVVPKSEVKWLESEVDRLLLLVDYNHSVLEQEVQDAKAEVAREIFKDILNIIRNYSYDAMRCGNNYGITQAEYIGIDILELKKKYTDEKSSSMKQN